MRLIFDNQIGKIELSVGDDVFDRMALMVPELVDDPRGKRFVADEEAWAFIEALPEPKNAMLVKHHPTKPAPGFFNGVPILVDGRRTVMTPIDTTRSDLDSHIERINPAPHGESHAWLPRAAGYHAPGSNPELEPVGQPPEPSEPKSYMLMERAFVGDVLKLAGEVVWLQDHEVGPHHVPVEIADDKGAEDTEGAAGKARKAQAPAADSRRK
jgi:hypothetical protein